MLQGTKGAYKNTCISNLSQKEIKEAVPSVIASKRIKYFGINKKRHKNSTVKTTKYWWNKVGKTVEMYSVLMDCKTMSLNLPHSP